MSRTACVWIPRFELNARLAQRPQLRGEQVIVAETGSARAVVVDASAEARASGVQPGMSLVTARALCPGATIIPPDPAFVREHGERILAALYQLAPVVGHDRQGAFFLRLQGLERLHPDEQALAARVGSIVRERSLPAAVAIADRPITAWIAAHSLQGADAVTPRRHDPIVPTPLIVARGDDRAFLAGLPAEAIPMPAQLQALCRLLGLETVADLQRLPAGALARRFGRAGAEVQQRIFARSQDVFRVEIPEIVEESALDLDDPTDELEVLLFVHESALHHLLARVAASRRVLAALELTLRLCGSARSTIQHTLRPARPTLDARTLLDLIVLWLRGLGLPAPVDAIRLRAPEVCVATARQLSLFGRDEAQSREALARAIARLAAVFGKGRVVRPRLAERHLPEARLQWEPAAAAAVFAASTGGSADRAGSTTALRGRVLPVLRLLSPPRRSRFCQQRGLLHIGGEPRVRRVVASDGPFHVEGEWWRPEPGFARAYLLVFTDAGEVCWLFRDDAAAHEVDDAATAGEATGAVAVDAARTDRWYLHAYLD